MKKLLKLQDFIVQFAVFWIEASLEFSGNHLLFEHL